MDMQLNQDTIRKLREARAWSQSHLAEVASLSLRTVQRIEKTGQASLESAKALSSVLDIPLDELRKVNLGSGTVSASARMTPGLMAKAAALAATVFAILTSLVWLSTATAAPVMLDVAVSSKDTLLANVQLFNQGDEASEMRVDGVLKLIVVPHKVENGVRLALEFFRFSEGDYAWVASPEVIVENNQPAQVRIQVNAQQYYDLVIKPHL